MALAFARDDESLDDAPPEGSEWRAIAKAIREYLRSSYANAKLGIAGEAVPLRLCAYSGKGLGNYATGADGRADWSPEFYRHMDRIEQRTPRDRDLRFGYGELARAMEQLAGRYPDWHAIVTALDVHGVRIEDYCVDHGRDLTTVKRIRKKATFFLYETLRLNAHAAAERIEFVLIRVI